MSPRNDAHQNGNGWSEADAIQFKMLEVRRDLDGDVQEIAEGVRDLVEWRTYVRKYPWVFLGGAFLLGYVIVPRSRNQEAPSPTARAQSLANGEPFMPSSLKREHRVLDAVLPFVGNLLMRGVSNFVGIQTERILASIAEKSREKEPQ